LQYLIHGLMCYSLFLSNLFLGVRQFHVWGVRQLLVAPCL
jgi:hypothetical protein